MVDANIIAVLRALDANPPFSAEDAVAVYKLDPDAFTAAVDAGWARRWINRDGDTGKYQLSAAGWSELNLADNPPPEEG